MSRPLAYIDTSALLKRFVQEAHTAEMEHFLMAGSHRCVLSSLSLTELKSVLRRRQNEAYAAQRISAQTAQQAYAQVVMELAQGSWHFQAISEPVFSYAGELLDQLQSPLGTLDALHLACAKTARCGLMVTADRQLLRASEEAGLAILDLS